VAPIPVSDKGSPFHVPRALDVLGELVQRHRGLWLGLGRLESTFLAHDLRATPVTMPIYVCGLARSGSTILHEVIASHPGLATHRVKDYPLVFTPYWWRQATSRARPSPPRERAHQDRIMITPDSPDALEEMVWTAFFPRCHDPRVNNCIEADTRHPEFESFYRAHLGKLLLVERAGRYVAKANYHVARLPYLLRLFPDARFVLAVREPHTHIASLVRQQQRFAEGHRRYPRSRAIMERSGHFEFGLGRRPQNLGDTERARGIATAWEQGQEIRGWARSWDAVYRRLALVLERSAEVRRAAFVVRYEAFCAKPEETIRQLMSHCALPHAEQVIAKFASQVSLPDYYRHNFSPAELAAIREETSETAARWGY
jgi:hypothetical protein